MTARDRFKALMNFQPVDRLPHIEWALWWDKTIERWHEEGLPAKLTGDDEIRKWFSLEEYRQFWPEPRSGNFIEEGDDGFISIKSEKEYLLLKEELFPEPRFNIREIEKAAEAQERGDEVIWLTLEGFFWFPRTLFGIEEHLYAFYDHPDLMDRMNSDLLQWQLSTLEEFCRICTPDFITIAEDMTYNHGPMIGKELYDDRLLPWYRKLLPELTSRNIIPFMDTDGNVHEIIPWLEEAGFRGCLPLEKQAGSDPEWIRANYPGWLMIGGVDKLKMSGPENILKEELKASAELAFRGGYIPGIDHQTPPEVSLEKYRLYLKMMREIYRP